MPGIKPGMTDTSAGERLPPFHLLKFIDEIGDDVQAAVPELRVARVEPERRQQFGMMLGAARRQHREVAFGKSTRGFFVNGIQRIDEAIAERIGVDVKWRMYEMRNVGPERLVSGLELDGGAEALALH